ncbi:CLIP domain-containing serine protease 2-like [Homalodisca vitripennis]|uniref:CLIP domain-containing serine protease 2-like n=1 Tax=Homalodisca vitripennis TaxID=197043 RepID=UPI001EEADAFC|nr:CLIP domain-containing serine protease 2-like [Homalodisca vitripennis]
MNIGAVVALVLVHVATIVCCNSPTFYNAKYRQHHNWKLLPIDECGLRNSRASRVMERKTAEWAQYPWIALIYSYSEEGDSIRCGGVIINRRYVLTAAHCIYPEGWITVTLGEYTLLDPLTCGDDACSCSEAYDLPVHRTCAEETITHPYYTSRPDGLHEENDIALIRLNDPIPSYKGTAANHITPICLPAFAESSKYFEDKLLEVVGWGQMHSDAYLQTITVPLVAQERCENMWNNALVKRKFCPGGRPECMKTITEQFICASGIRGRGLCTGDSGVPLMVHIPLDRKSRSTKTFVVGVASHVIGDQNSDYDADCGSGVPDVFTRVSEYMTWILDNIKE